MFVSSLLRGMNLLKCFAFFGFGVAGIAPLNAQNTVANTDETLKNNNVVLPRLFFSSAQRRALENPNQAPQPTNASPSSQPAEMPILNQSWYLNGIFQKTKSSPMIWINGVLLSKLDIPFTINALNRQSIVFIDPKKIQPNTIVHVGETYQPGFVPSVTPNIHVKRH